MQSIRIGKDPATQYLLRLGDTCLILGQRICEWSGHAPILEEDIALSNMALDLIGQARALLTRAGQTDGPKGHHENQDQAESHVAIHDLRIPGQASPRRGWTACPQTRCRAPIRLRREG